MDDPQAKIDIKKGCQEVDGPDALGYARSRNTDEHSATSAARSGSARWSRRSATRSLSPWSVINPVRYWNLYMAGARLVRVSEGTSPFAMAQWALGDDRSTRQGSAAASRSPTSP